MAPKQRMRIANAKASNYITMRGNVPKSSVSVISEKLISDTSCAQYFSQHLKIIYEAYKIVSRVNGFECLRVIFTICLGITPFLLYMKR